jgi:hypothetical protein
MKEKEIIAAAAALEGEVRKSILHKLDQLKEFITLRNGSSDSSYYQMLMMIDDDLDDVLLNWEYEKIDPNFNLDDSDLDDDDDDY